MSSVDCYIQLYYHPVKCLTNIAEIEAKMNEMLDTDSKASIFEFSYKTYKQRIGTNDFINEFIRKSYGEIVETRPCLIHELEQRMHFRLKKTSIQRLRIQKKGKYKMYDENVFSIIQEFLE